MAHGQIKSVDIKIDPNDLETLKKNGYQLCFAKKVNDTYNVVWQSSDEYLADNAFSWQPMYELFGSNVFSGNVRVRVSTNKVAIGLGDQSVLDSSGVLQPATSGGPATGITMVNQYGNIHPGLSSYATGIDGQSSTSPIYVAEKQIVLGSDTLTPVEAVQVWFEQDIVTSTMFSTARSNAVEIDLTDQNSAARLYHNGAWSIPAPGAPAVDPMTILTIVVVLTGAVIAQDLASKITSKLTGVYKDVTVNVQVAPDKKLTIKYQEKKGLSGVRREQIQLLLANPNTVDQLTAFALESLASTGVGYLLLEANSS